MNLPPVYPATDFINDLRVYAHNDWCSRQIELRFVHYGGLGGRAVSLAKPLVMNAVGEGDGQFIEPTMRLYPNTAQSLMDQLWQCGVRPTEGTGSAGSLAATQKHLEDFRTIAFKLLETNGNHQS